MTKIRKKFEGVIELNANGEDALHFIRERVILD